MVAGSVTSAAVTGAPAWDVVVGERFIAAIAAPSPDRCSSALADASTDERIGIEQLVGLVPVGGADAVESFAILWWPRTGGEVTAVVRGTAVGDLGSPGGVRRFDARGIHPWHLAEFGGVTALRITSAESPLDGLGDAPDPGRQSRAGLRASSVEWAPGANGSGGARLEHDMVRGHSDSDTQLMVTRHPADAEGPVATTPISVIPEAMILRSEVTALRTDPSANPSQPQDGSPDAEAATSLPYPPGFRIGSGPVRRVTGPVLVGRRPLPPRIPDRPDSPVELVTVASPGGVVSGTHLELRVQGERLVATDLRSTNGTIGRPSSGVRRMRAGESIVVAPGTSLDLGDGTIIQIVHSPERRPE
ncbi:FHA domain-containing protein [Agromyces sp. Marseille-P2726]|uniref:FHA domain-containing protein n=1 Tax=Agromyces sp. Marseille-P2726 TaxID=2709132 RepID=UPI001570CF22|nr:FHA domain-containing protein [Agromyces sp. Marseille-P2726]